MLERIRESTERWLDWVFLGFLVVLVALCCVYNRVAPSVYYFCLFFFSIYILPECFHQVRLREKYLSLFERRLHALNSTAFHLDKLKKKQLSMREYWLRVFNMVFRAINTILAVLFVIGVLVLNIGMGVGNCHVPFFLDVPFWTGITAIIFSTSFLLITAVPSFLLEIRRKFIAATAVVLCFPVVIIVLSASFYFYVMQICP